TERRADDVWLGAVDARRDVLGDPTLVVDRVQPVAVDSENERASGDPRERRGHATAAPPHVVRNHRLGQGDVAVGVEASRELVAVKVEVTLDRVAAATAERTDAALPRPREALVQLGR